MLIPLHLHVKCLVSHTICCAQGEVTLSTGIKVAIKLLQFKKLSFATPCQPGAKTSIKLALENDGEYKDVPLAFFMLLKSPSRASP